MRVSDRRGWSAVAAVAAWATLTSSCSVDERQPQASMGTTTIPEARPQDGEQPSLPEPTAAAATGDESDPDLPLDPPAGEEQPCDDDSDNDGDQLIDCEDADCEGRVCRRATSVCDVAETCSQSRCPEDLFASERVSCRPAARECDSSETCTGVSGECPPDDFLPASTVCRLASGPCEADALCTGESAACPENLLLDSRRVSRRGWPVRPDRRELHGHVDVLPGGCRWLPPRSVLRR